MKESPKDLRAQLEALGASSLAETLVELATVSKEVETAVGRLIASPKERLSRFKRKLSGLKRRKGFIYRSEALNYARKLTEALEELNSSRISAEDGLKALLEFYKADAAIIEACDDSYGSVGEVFRFEGVSMFVRFATQVDEKVVIKSLLSLLQVDDYGVRFPLLERLRECLSEAGLRTLVEELTLEKGRRSEKHHIRHFSLMLCELSTQLSDPILYESLIREERAELLAVDHVNIAEIHLELGNYESALDWVERSPSPDGYRSHEWTKVRLRCLRELGQNAEHQAQAWEVFSQHPSPDAFETLVAEVGEEKRMLLAKKVATTIQKDPKFSSSKAALLLSLGLADEAEQFVLARAVQVDGMDYYSLPELAQAFQNQELYCGAIVCYRALLESILQRANSKAYRHAAKYYKALERLAVLAPEVDGISTHPSFFASIKERHFRKSSFWERLSE